MTQTTLLIAAVVALLLVGGAVALLLLIRRRRRRPAPRGLRTIHPVVLVHGLFGFAEMGVGPWRARYFRGVADHLTRMGVTVYCPRLPAVASVAVRAQQLATFIEELPERRVNIIGHSMGGIDARYAVAHTGIAPAVASITSIGSPHRGTSLAALATEVLLEKMHLGRLLTFLRVDIEAFYELTVARMKHFNATVPDPRDVACGSVIGALDPGSRAVHRLLRPGFAYLARQEGANDGLVGGASQRWGDVLAEVQADHMAQIGWSRHFDAVAMFEQLVRELRGRGL